VERSDQRFKPARYARTTCNTNIWHASPVVRSHAPPFVTFAATIRTSRRDGVAATERCETAQPNENTKRRSYMHYYVTCCPAND
jgi:hypothetical protein